MKYRILYIVAIFASLFAVSCNKENGEEGNELIQMPITITARYGDAGTKVAYTESGASISAAWEAEDQLLVAYDGHVSTLTLSSGAGSASATFSGTISYTHTPGSSSLLACYVKDRNNPGALTVTDGDISYSSAAFLSQDGTLAGAAKCNTYFGAATYGDGSNINCIFSVNTSMMKFTLKDVCDDAGKAATLVYKSGSSEIVKASFTVTAGYNYIYLAIPAMVYSGEQSLVYNCATSSTTKTIVLNDSQAHFETGQTYSKNITFRAGAIYSRFSVSSSKKVWFSCGNLQYIGSAATPYWKFADNQWDFIGKTDGQRSMNADADRDYFGYGTSGYNNGQTSYQPWSSSSSSGKYYTSDLSGSADWGYNAIRNGGNQENSGWRTPSKDDLLWLLGPKDAPNPGTNCRTASTVNGTANARFAKAVVNGVNGLIIFPDSYTHPSGVAQPINVNDYASKFTGNNFNDTNWTEMESAGCVFLPAAGYRSPDEPYSQINLGGCYYWTSSNYDTNSAYNLYVDSGYSNPNNDWWRDLGMPVRLVKDAD